MQDSLIVAYNDTPDETFLLVARQSDDRNIILSRFEGECARDLYKILTDKAESEDLA